MYGGCGAQVLEFGPTLLCALYRAGAVASSAPPLQRARAAVRASSHSELASLFCQMSPLTAAAFAQLFLFAFIYTN